MAAELIDNYCEKSETPLAQKINTHNIRSELVVSQSPRMFFSRKLVSGWRQQDQETVAASSFDDHISASHNNFKLVILDLLLMQKNKKNRKKIQCRSIKIILSVQCLDSFLGK